MGKTAAELLQIATPAVGIGAPIVGGILQSRAAADQAAAGSSAALQNARLAELEGNTEAARRRRAGGQEITRQRVISGAGDVRLEGTPADFLAQQAYEVERDAVNAEIAGRRTARLERAQARSIQKAGKVSARNALIGGAGQALNFGLSLRR